MKRLLFLAVALLTAAVTALPASAAPATATDMSAPVASLGHAGLLAAGQADTEGGLAFTFEGSGWGHGVGFSQYGARGQAVQDPSKSGAEIATYYYAGTQVENLDALSLSSDALSTVENPLWINLDTNRSSLTFTGRGGELDLCLSGDGEGPCPKPEHPQAGETWTFETKPEGGCAFFRNGVQQGTDGHCQAAIAWPDATDVVVEDVCGYSDEYDCAYRYGELKIRPAGSGFHVSLALPLEEYLRGLGELPVDWKEPGANEGQVLAARSYAVYEFLRLERQYTRTDINAGVPTSCYCHMFDDARDQLYVGYEVNGTKREQLADAWVEAVETTVGDVITRTDGTSYTESGVIKGFYFSATAGWTESNTVGFGSTVQWPYLVPVDDHWSLSPDLGNPNLAWSETITAARIADILGVDEVTSATPLNGPPNAQVVFGVVDGGVAGTRIRGGTWLRLDLDLLSAGLVAIDGVPAGPPPPFDDIFSSVHYESILAILDAGITEGCDANSFCPRQTVTRGQMASFIARAMDLPVASGDHFSDDDDSVHEDNINRLFEAGVTSGCGSGDGFCPEDLLNRGQMAVFLARALNLTESGADVFGDDDGTPYEGAINALADAGITDGCLDGRYCPYWRVTRDQMASFLARAFLVSS